MPIVKNNLFVDGDIPTAAELNQPYDDAQTASAAVDSTNTKDNWITIKHFNTGAPCNQLFDYIYDGTSSWSSSATSYTTIDSPGGDPSDIVLNYQPNTFEMLRVEASGLVTAIEAESTYNSAAIPPNGDRNYYAFRLLLTYDDGGAPITISLGEWGYSFTSMAGGTSRYYTAADGSPSNTGVPLGYQTFQFSTCLFYGGAPATRTYQKIELQAKVNYNGNTLVVTRNNILAVRAKH